MRRNAKENPDKAAVVFEDDSLNWSELWQRVESASGNLEPFFEGDSQQVAALLLTNSTEFVVAYLAVLHLGHIAFPMEPAYKKLELDAMLEEIPPSVLITDSHYQSQVSGGKFPVVMATELMAARSKVKKLLRLPADEQIAAMTFTSGTTGTPKAVPNTHANHLWTIGICSKVWKWTAYDSMLISIPLSHWYGLVLGIGAAVYHGNSLYLLDQRFDSQKTLDMLSSGKISIYQHISVVYTKLVTARGDYDLSKVRLFISGGAPLPPEIWHQFKERFGAEILETYGSSETGRIAANRLDDKPMLGSPGRILPGVDMKLSGNREVLIKSPGVFPGYWQNPSATKKAYTEDGYFRTGDIAELRDGYIYLKSRVAERIRRFGYTVSPRDVEWAMLKHPKIRDIYVMGKQNNADSNDELIYFVVGDISDEEIKEYAKQNLVFAWRADKVIYMERLPRTGSGKPRVAEFRKLVGAGT